MKIWNLISIKKGYYLLYGNDLERKLYYVNNNFDNWKRIFPSIDNIDEFMLNSQTNELCIIYDKCKLIIFNTLTEQVIQPDEYWHAHKHLYIEGYNKLGWVITEYNMLSDSFLTKYFNGKIYKIISNHYGEIQPLGNNFLVTELKKKLLSWMSTLIFNSVLKESLIL